MQFLLTEPHQFTGVAEADWLALMEQQILESLPPVQVGSHVAQVGLQAPFPSISGAVNAIGAIQAELPEDAGSLPQLVRIDGAEVGGRFVLLQVENTPDTSGCVLGSAGFTGTVVVVNNDPGLAAVVDHLGDLADHQLAEISVVLIDAQAASHSTG